MLPEISAGSVLRTKLQIIRLRTDPFHSGRGASGSKPMQIWERSVLLLLGTDGPAPRGALEWCLQEAVLDSLLYICSCFHKVNLVNQMKQLLAQPWFYVQFVIGKGDFRWNEKIQCTLADWKINWFQTCTSEGRCYSSQAKDGLRFDISAGKSKFCPIHVSFPSDTIKNHLALFSPPLTCC